MCALASYGKRNVRASSPSLTELVTDRAKNRTLACGTQAATRFSWKRNVFHTSFIIFLDEIINAGRHIPLSREGVCGKLDAGSGGPRFLTGR